MAMDRGSVRLSRRCIMSSADMGVPCLASPDHEGES